MSSGMNRTQAEEYAKTMTYKQAIRNIRTGKGVMYRKATMIKLHELAEIADRLTLCKDCIYKYVSGNGTTQYYVCDFMDAQYEDDGFCHHGESEVEE